MSRVTDGLNTLQTQGNQALFITLLSNAINTLNEAVAALAVPVVKGKEVKKEVPKKGAAPVVEVIDPYTQIERIVIESKRQCVCIVKLISNIFIALSLFDKDYVTAESTATIASSVSKVVLNSILQTITRDALVHPLDCPVFDVINTACVLFGTLSKVNEALRVVVCDNGGLLAVCNVLLQSRNIICAINPIDPTAVIPVSTTPPLTAEEQEKQNTLRLNNLRRVCGKAVLHLLTAKRDSAPVEWSYSSESTPPARWESCSAYLTSVPHFQSVLTQIIEMIAAVDDADLVNRGVRVLSACLLSTENQTMMFDFIVASGVDSLVIAKLSNVLSLRGQSVVDHFVQKAASEATAAAAALTSGVEGSEPQEGEAVEQSLTGAVEGGVISADIAPLAASSLAPVETQDLLVPTIFDTYYLAWTIIESLLLCNNPLTTPDCLKALVTRDRVKVVSQTLAVMGSVSGSSVPTFEFSLPLYDPRVHNWYTTLDVNNTNSAQTADQTAYDSFRSDEVYLRTLILDTLALVPQMDAKYRTYESDVPVAPPLPLPPSKCSVEEAVLLICTGVADVTCGILLYQGAYKFNGSGNLVIVPAGEATNSLHLFSLNSSIKLLTAICSVGALGVTGALESIAENGFKSQLIDESSSLNVNLSSQQTLIKFLTTATNNTQIVPESHAWKRPLFYSDIFGGEEVLTSSARITENIALFPFITLTSSILCILSDPNIKGDTIIFALKTLFAMTKTNVWSETSQPVILDLLSTVFLSLSGGVTLASLVGRFGHVSEKDSMELEIGAFCRYLLSRGRDREAFWTQYAEENKPVEVIDPKTGKPIVKKEDKKPPPKDTKKIDPKAVIVVPVVSEILYNVESTVETPDPNKGPTAGYWTKLLDLSTDYDLHLNSSSTRVTVLTSAIQSLLTDIALLVIAQDVDGHSVLKYALMSMAPGEVDRVLCGHLDARFVADTAPWRVYGTAALLSLLLTTSAQHNLSLNINVRDSQGYSPVLLSLGLGGIELSVGGIPLSLQSHNSVENQDSDFLREDKSAYDDVQTMFEYRADMNACDLVGITPLHLAAARGDSKLISQLYSYSVTANVCDANGFLPLHYVSTCCPAVKLRETFDLLIQAENVNLIRALVGTVKVDINSLDAVSNLSPFHEACLTQNVDIVRAFAQGVSRLDLLGAQSSGSEENCVEYVVRSGNVEMLKELIAMRRNDVIESLISHAYNSHASPLKEPPTASSAPSRKLTLDEDDMRMRGEEFRAHLEDIGEGELLVDVPLLLDTDPHPFDSLLLRLERRNLFLGRRIKATWASDEKLEGGDEVGGEGQSGYGRGGDDEEVGWNVGDRQAPETGGGGDDVIDALAGELDGLSFNPNGLKAAQDNSINAEPDPDALNTTVDGEVIAGVVIDPPLQVVTGGPEVDSPSGPPPLTFAEYLVTYEELQASNEVLRVVLDLVNGTGIVDASNHVCEQYFRGELMVLPDFE
eukprot:gene24113-30421_t